MTCKRILATQGILLRRAQIVDFYHNGMGPEDRITVTILVKHQSPAFAALRPSSSPRAFTVEILRHGRVVAGITVKATSGGGGVAVWGLAVSGSISVGIF